ncbi:hypothetical protein ADIAL_0428 [Alkalibacterium sp. AK22]|uniref:hypothetical protein n=1 Tax=Alkalibacterium sp. AK22 TaxID=1229520 RepID=UPI0004462176|nr:hypothetical protein [Alkalibacterium sp. AK22]EXJ24048.1 hypothetical protein ADIAL_0428 [Alkalibacterium sp. AK22]
MEKCINDEIKDVQQYAQSIGMTLEEYTLSLHSKNQKVKSVLLGNGTEFKHFVEEFYALLDEMAIYKETDAKKTSPEHYERIKQVVHLLSTTSADPKLLAQLYHHYPNGIQNGANELHVDLI